MESEKKADNSQRERDRKLIDEAMAGFIQPPDYQHSAGVDTRSQALVVAGASEETADFIDSNRSLTLDAVSQAVNEGPMKSFGDYEILEVLGRGGMGIVYKARQRSLGRLVALKMIRSGVFADDRELLRFQTEVESVASLDHPNIIPVLEFGEVGTHKFFTMKLVEGGPLSSQLDRYTSTPKRIAEVMLAVSSALQHAHQRGILHRDLKPANVLIDEAGTPYVTDFGLARRLDGQSALTATGEALGTPSYMAPEQAAGRIREIGTATDIYGLGGILYALLTKQAPFRGDSVLQILDLVRNSSPRAPREFNPVVARDLEVICMKCLQHAPEQRYATAGELAEEFENFLQGRPIRARPLTASQRFRLWCSRNPTTAFLSLSAIGLLLIATAVSSWSAITLSARNKIISQQNDDIRKNNILLTEARDEAEQNLELAEERAELTLESYQVLIDQADNELREIPGADDARKKLLLLAADGLRKLAEEMSKSSKAEPTLATSLVKLADLLIKEPGYDQEALALYREALSVLSDRETLASGTAESQYNVGLTLLRLARLLFTTDRSLDEIEAMYRQSVEYLTNVYQLAQERKAGEITAPRALKSLLDAHQALELHYLRLGAAQKSIDQSMLLLGNRTSEPW